MNTGGDRAISKIFDMLIQEIAMNNAVGMALKWWITPPAAYTQGKPVDGTTGDGNAYGEGYRTAGGSAY